MLSFSNNLKSTCYFLHTRIPLFLASDFMILKFGFKEHLKGQECPTPAAYSALIHCCIGIRILNRNSSFVGICIETQKQLVLQ